MPLLAEKLDFVHILGILELVMLARVWFVAVLHIDYMNAIEDLMSGNISHRIELS